MKGIVFNIQRMSIHDGPGIRTTVFFKGCPLNCLWCSNPESQCAGLEISFIKNRCIGCGYCEQVCPQQIIHENNDYGIEDTGRCDLCMKCVEECCTGSRKVIGQEYTVEELHHEILKDKSFYDSSDGGVTFSGGEPFMQSDFLLEMLKCCKDSGLHTAIETTGETETEIMLEALELLDLVFFDLKHMNDRAHTELTGISNRKILGNLKVAAENHNNIIVRIPVIPGLNDSDENIYSTAKLAADLSVSALELLPYHNLGESKYRQLGREYTLSGIKNPSKERMEEIAGIAKQAIGNRETAVRIMEL